MLLLRLLLLLLPLGLLRLLLPLRLAGLRVQRQRRLERPPQLQPQRGSAFGPLADLQSGGKPKLVNKTRAA